LDGFAARELRNFMPTRAAKEATPCVCSRSTRSKLLHPLPTMKQTGSRKGNEGVEMKFSYQWHGRLGWVIAPLLAVQALGGAMLLWMQPLPTSHDSPPAIHEWAHAVDAGVAELASRYPAAKIEYVNLPRDAHGPVSVRLLASPSNESGWADIDIATAQAGALQPDNSRLKTFLYGLHEHMLFDDAGPWVMRATAIVALVLVAMGLRVWWRVRTLPPRSSWRRVHRLLGPVFVLPLSMMLFTGFMLRSPDWARSLFALWPAAAAATPPAAAPPAAAPQVATLGQALNTAAKALPQSQPIRIYPANNGVASVRMRGEEWHPLGLDRVFVNVAAPNAPVKRIVRASEQPLTVRYLNVIYPLHIGWLPGTPSVAAALAIRAVWTLLALALAGLAVSGAVQRFRTK
jgi:uncharacterized iron-regulated membrane protein